MQITVSQHIYSNVPKEQSPHGRRGYQTLFYTRDGITAEEVRVIEERVLYYGGDKEPTKWQFYLLPGGKAVVTHIVPLPEPDEFGRKGRYLAHSLVLSPTTFAAMQNSPLPLFASSHFFVELATVFSAGDAKTGHIPARTIAIYDQWEDNSLQAARQWSPEQLVVLARTGWQAKKLQEERLSLAFLGTDSQILRALSIIFLLTAPQKRVHLTFDLYAYGCDWTRKWPFWAWAGLAETATTTYKIDAANCHVQAPLPPQQDTLFEQWVAQVAIPQRLEYFHTDRDDALRLERFFNGEPVDCSTVNAQLGDFFARQSLAALSKQLLTFFPDGLSPATQTKITADVRQQPWEYAQLLTKGITVETVVRVLSNILLLSLGQPVDETDRKSIEKWLKKHSHPELIALLLLWCGDIAGWQKKIDRLPASTYGAHLEKGLATRVLSPVSGFSATHLTTWSEVVPGKLAPGQLAAILKLLTKEKKALPVDALMSLLPYMQANDRVMLQKWLQTYKGDAPRLRHALAGDVPPTKQFSLANRVKSWFSRKPAEGKQPKPGNDSFQQDRRKKNG